MAKSHKFEQEDYTLEIHARNFSLTEAIRDYVLKKIAKIERFSKHVLDIHVVLQKQKLEHSTLMVLRFLQTQVRSKAVTDDIYSSIDKASDKLLRLIEKYKSQLQDHHNTPCSTIDLAVNVLSSDNAEIEEINAEIEENNFAVQQRLYHPHEITESGRIRVRMLTQSEAIMHMELSGNHFMIYKSEEEQTLKVIYRREDATFGLVDIEISQKNL